jgi:hypothetical protein
MRVQSPAIPLSNVLALFTAMALFGGLPGADELRRCFLAKRAAPDWRGYAGVPA